MLLFLALGGCSQSDSGGAIGSLPGVPALSANAIDSAIELSWTPVSGAVSYKIYWSTVDNFQPSAAEGVIPVSGANYVHDGLTNGTSYYYVITLYQCLIIYTRNVF